MLEERQIDVEDIEQEIDTIDGRKSYVCYVNALTLATHDFIDNVNGYNSKYIKFQSRTLKVNKKIV